MSLLRAAFAVSALAPSAFGQITAPACQPGWEWSFNSLGQNPCEIAAYLQSVCIGGGAFNIPPVTPGHHYNGPSNQKNGPACSCNSVVYNLISACDACQGAEWLPWSGWSLNCTQVSQPGTYPFNIPAGTRVPHWAYLDTTGNNTWNNSTAFAAGDFPESTATAAPSATSGAQTGDFRDRHHSSHVGAIAGGVGGGIVGLALIAGIAAWLVRRNCLHRNAPSKDTHVDMFHDGYSVFLPSEQAPPNSLFLPTEQAPPSYYDPSNPSTYPLSSTSPTTPTMSTIQTTNTGAVSQSSNTKLRPKQRAHSGLPNI